MLGLTHVCIYFAEILLEKVKHQFKLIPLLHLKLSFGKSLCKIILHFPSQNLIFSQRLHKKSGRKTIRWKIFEDGLIGIKAEDFLLE